MKKYLFAILLSVTAIQASAQNSGLVFDDDVSRKRAVDHAWSIYQRMGLKGLETMVQMCYARMERQHLLRCLHFDYVGGLLNGAQDSDNLAFFGVEQASMRSTVHINILLQSSGQAHKTNVLEVFEKNIGSIRPMVMEKLGRR